MDEDEWWSLGIYYFIFFPIWSIGGVVFRFRFEPQELYWTLFAVWLVPLIPAACIFGFFVCALLAFLLRTLAAALWDSLVFSPVGTLEWFVTARRAVPFARRQQRRRQGRRRYRNCRAHLYDLLIHEQFETALSFLGTADVARDVLCNPPQQEDLWRNVPPFFRGLEFDSGDMTVTELLRKGTRPLHLIVAMAESPLEDGRVPLSIAHAELLLQIAKQLLLVRYHNGRPAMTADYGTWSRQSFECRYKESCCGGYRTEPKFLRLPDTTSGRKNPLEMAQYTLAKTGPNTIMNAMIHLMAHECPDALVENDRYRPIALASQWRCWTITFMQGSFWFPVGEGRHIVHGRFLDEGGDNEQELSQDVERGIHGNNGYSRGKIEMLEKFQRAEILLMALYRYPHENNNSGSLNLSQERESCSPWLLHAVCVAASEFRTTEYDGAAMPTPFVQVVLHFLRKKRNNNFGYVGDSRRRNRVPLALALSAVRARFTPRLGCDQNVRDCFEVLIKLLLEAYPGAARLTDADGRIALHHALASSVIFCAGASREENGHWRIRLIKRIVEDYPEALGHKDPVTGLFPWMLVVSRVIVETRGTLSLIRLNYAYELLRNGPSFLIESPVQNDDYRPLALASQWQCWTTNFVDGSFWFPILGDGEDKDQLENGTFGGNKYSRGKVEMLEKFQRAEILLLARYNYPREKDENDRWPLSRERKSCSPWLLHAVCVAASEFRTTKYDGAAMPIPFVQVVLFYLRKNQNNDVGYVGDSLRRNRVPLALAFTSVAVHHCTKRRGCDRDVKDCFEALIRLLLEAYPGAARLPDEDGRIPLHLALISSVLFRPGDFQGEDDAWRICLIRRIVEDYPEALGHVDPVTGLFPWMLMASRVIEETTGTVSLIRLNYTYELLRNGPHFLPFTSSLHGEED